MADDALNIASNTNSQMLGNHGVTAGISRNLTDSGKQQRLGGRQFKRDARLQQQRYDNEAQLAGYKSQLKREEMTHGGNLTQYGKSMDHGVHNNEELAAAGGNIGAGISSSRRASEYRDADGNVAGEVSAKYGNVQTGGYKLPARKAAENPNSEGQQFGTPASRKKGAKLEKSEGIPFTLGDAKEEPGTPVDTPTTRLMKKEDIEKAPDRLERATDVVMPKRAKKAPAKKKK
jgi:hypothetical protein